MRPPSGAGGHGKARSQPGVDAHETPAGGHGHVPASEGAPILSRFARPRLRAASVGWLHQARVASARRRRGRRARPSPEAPESAKTTTASGSLGAIAAAATGSSVSTSADGMSPGLPAIRSRPSAPTYAMLPSGPTPSTVAPGPAPRSVVVVPDRASRWTESPAPADQRGDGWIEGRAGCRSAARRAGQQHTRRVGHPDRRTGRVEWREREPFDGQLEDADGARQVHEGQRLAVRRIAWCADGPSLVRGFRRWRRAHAEHSGQGDRRGVAAADVPLPQPEPAAGLHVGTREGDALAVRRVGRIELQVGLIGQDSTIGAVGALVDESPAVRDDERAAVRRDGVVEHRLQLGADLALPGAVGVHDPHVRDARAVGDERDPIREGRRGSAGVERPAQRLGHRPAGRSS